MELLLPYRFDGPPVQMAVWRRPIMLAQAHHAGVRIRQRGKEQAGTKDSALPVGLAQPSTRP